MPLGVSEILRCKAPFSITLGAACARAQPDEELKDAPRLRSEQFAELRQAELHGGPAVHLQQHVSRFEPRQPRRGARVDPMHRMLPELRGADRSRIPDMPASNGSSTLSLRRRYRALPL
jgi:hypothetical protein